MFATDNQLSLLARSRALYMDGTFHLVRKPFLQIFTINVFLRSNECMKQVPVVLFLMSRRNADDYREIFGSLKSMVGHSMDMEKLEVDYEAATSDEFPAAKKSGCCFHFRQAVYRNLLD